MNLFSLIVSPVYAQAADVIGEIKPPASVISQPSDVGRLISVLIQGVVVIAGLFSLLQFILGGLGYITAGGDSKKIQESLHKITYSIIGLVIIAASFIIMAIISQLLFGSATYLLSPQLQTL